MGQRQIGCVASPNTSIARVTADLLIWRLLLSFGSPFRRLVAVCLLFGRNLYTLAEELQRWILSSLGWLSAPPSTAILRHLGTGFLQTRRWHFGAGGHTFPQTMFMAARCSDFPVGYCFLRNNSALCLHVLSQVLTVRDVFSCDT